MKILRKHAAPSAAPAISDAEPDVTWERAEAPPPRRSSDREDQPAPVPPDASWPAPWVQMKYYTYTPTVFPRMIAAASPGIKPGALGSVSDRNGARFGAGFHNAKARVPLRMVYHGLTKSVKTI